MWLAEIERSNIVEEKLITIITSNVDEILYKNNLFRGDITEFSVCVEILCRVVENGNEISKHVF